MIILYSIFIIFFFGACLGSFLNCVIYRLEKKKSFVKGRSFCPYCRHILKWHDLIPILSFIILKRKCRYCGKKISWQYPLVEISTGLIALLIWELVVPLSTVCEHWVTASQLSNFQTITNFIYLIIISCFLIVIFVYDSKHYIIPDKVIYPVIGIALIFNFFILPNFTLQNLGGQAINFYNSILSAIGAGSFFFLLWLLSRGKWMGLGDSKIGFLMGLFLGFPNILVALFLAFLLGAIVGLGLISASRKKLKSQLPFGPFLVTGTFTALFWAEEIINWYLHVL